jgi:TPR repeat protein
MDKNVPWAASELVYILLERGTRADLKRAFDIANQGSKNNDYRCMLVLGEMYASGMYVKKDPDKAIEWINLGEKLRK